MSRKNKKKLRDEYTVVKKKSRKGKRKCRSLSSKSPTNKRGKRILKREFEKTGGNYNQQKDNRTSYFKKDELRKNFPSTRVKPQLLQQPHHQQRQPYGGNLNWCINPHQKLQRVPSYPMNSVFCYQNFVQYRINPFNTVIKPDGSMKAIKKKLDERVKCGCDHSPNSILYTCAMCHGLYCSSYGGILGSLAVCCDCYSKYQREDPIKPVNELLDYIWIKIKNPSRK